jgi:SAM-dependent methyltransferase
MDEKTGSRGGEVGALRRHAPATERNRDPILTVLSDVLPPRGVVLEVASGTGQHAVHFAGALPHLTWQPTDAEEASLQSIEAWRQEAGVANVRPALRLDAARSPWPVQQADAVVCINMVHISPWQACEGLMAGAARVLPAGGPLVLYGPYFIEGRPTAPSNLTFDASLRAQNPAWGVRQLEAVLATAAAHGLVLERVVDMPSNNFTVVLRRAP